MWERLGRPEISNAEAFEALCVQLFRLWGRREGAPNGRFAAIYGAGGDHGVEAIHETVSGDFVGLQVKYHHKVDAGILRKLNESLDAARKRYPRLMKYVIALPRDRSNKKATSQSKDELTRWNEWESKATGRHPGLEITYWGKAEIEAELARPEAVQFRSFFFDASWMAPAEFDARVSAGLKTSTFGHRYVPELHTELAYERRVRQRLGERGGVGKVIVRLDAQLELAARVNLEIERLPRLGVTYSAEEDAARHDAADAIAAWQRDARRVRDWVEHGTQGDFDPRILDGSPVVLQRLHDVLTARPGGMYGRDATMICAEALERFLSRWQQLSAVLAPLHRIGAPIVLTGPAGSGKTHALAHLAQEWNDAVRPVLLLAGADFDPRQATVRALLEHIADRHVESPERLLSALEGAAEVAARTEVDRNADASPGTRALLLIDGIDEQPGHIDAWRELIIKLVAIARSYPRVQVVVSLRDTALPQFWGPHRGKEPEWVTVEVNPDELPLDVLFERYCTRYGLSVPAGNDLRWWFTTPLHVRLFVELYRLTRTPPDGPNERSIARLFGRLLEAASQTLAREFQGEKPCAMGLQALVDAMQASERRALPWAEALRVLKASLEPSFPVAAESGPRVLSELAGWGFLLTTTRPATDPLQPDERWIMPAYEAVVDFLLARKALAAGDEAWRDLRYRSYALELYALMRTTGDDSFDWLDDAKDRDDPRDDSLYLAVLSQVPAALAETERERVADLLMDSMPARCNVVSKLLFPVMRRRGHPFAPPFAHGVLAPLGVAERDIVWSGPSLLRGVDDEPWSGWGHDPLPTIVLRSDDRADGPPLLLAWATTSLERGKRDHARRQLAEWMLRASGEVASLVGYVAQSNDPQMHEDVVAAVTSASLRWDTNAPWTDVASALEAFYRALSPESQDDCVLRAGLWAFLQRGRVLKALAPTVWWRQVAPAGDPLSGPVQDDRALPLSRARLEKEEPGDYFVGSNLVSMDLGSYVLKKAYEPFFHSAWEPQTSRATKVLRRHAEVYDLEACSPAKLALAFVERAAADWGWSDKTFYGDPGGEEPGERPGYDIAVLRQYHPATHGSQSRIARPAEKYTWLAINRVAGYLADRLELKGEAGRFVKDLAGLGSGLALVNVGDASPSTLVSSLAEPSGWSPVIPLPKRSQVEDAVHWQTRAPVPGRKDVQAWLLDVSDAEWVTLHRSFLRTEPNSLCEVAIQIGGVVVAKTAVPRLRASTHGPDFAARHTSLEAGGFYISPALATWAPWIRDHQEEGEFATAQVYYEDVDTDGVGQERSVWLPGERFRRGLSLSRAATYVSSDGDRQALRFFDRDGREVGKYDLLRARSFREHDEALQVHRDALTALGDQVLMWHVRMIREPAYYLYPDGKGRPDRDIVDWLAFIDSSGALTVGRPKRRNAS